VLCGVVKETNRGPFPGSLENVNEFEFIVEEPILSGHFQYQEAVGKLVVDPDGKRLAVYPEDICEPRGSVQTVYLVPPGKEFVPITISNLKAYRGKTLPDGITLRDLDSGFRSWEYFNRINNSMYGFTVDESSMISGDFSWMMIELDITNDSNSLKEFHHGIGDIVTYDSAGNVYTFPARWLRFLEEGQDLRDLSNTTFTLNPHETKTIRWMIVAPDIALDDPTLFLLVTPLARDTPPEVRPEGYPEKLQGIRVEF
jgi:hypothetical protein